MSKLQQINIQSLLNIEKQKLWKDIWDFENINKELAPYARMTPPSIALNEIDVDAIPLNQQLFDSYVFLFWIVPVDIHHFKLKNITEFDSFEETSTSLLMKQWNHSFLGKMTLPVYKKIFQHRHKYLRAQYNN